MNRHGDTFRAIMIPLIALFLVILALSFSGKLNTGRFPDKENVPANADSAETRASQTTTASTESSPDIRINAAGVEQPDYESDYYIAVFLKTQNVLVYGKDDAGGYNDIVKCFSCSTGCEGHETRTGMYSIIRRYRWRLLVGDVYGQYSTGFSDSYLFHSVPYIEEDASTLDMAEYDKLGTPASHGCVRLCVRDAKWIFENCPDGTQVNIIDGSNDAKGEPIPPREKDDAHAGWDPSDPDSASPYNS